MRYVAAVFAAVVLFELLRYLEELAQGLAASRGALVPRKARQTMHIGAATSRFCIVVVGISCPQPVLIPLLITELSSRSCGSLQCGGICRWGRFLNCESAIFHVGD